VVSRVSWMLQDQLCEIPVDDDTACVHLYKPETSTNKYHTVSPELFEIMFDHQVFTPTNGVTGKQQDASDAPLYFSDGRIFYPADINPAGNGSFTRPDSQPFLAGYYNILGRHSISLQTLLEAAGIPSLDAPAPGLFDAGSTLRYTGVTLMLRIIYSNYAPFDFVQAAYPSYHYEVKQGSTYAAVHTVTRQANTTIRLFENRHGIKLVITQEGSLGAFTLVNLMFFFGGAVATLALASLIVDNVVLRFFIPEQVRQILDLASATTIPVRADLNLYMKAVAENMDGGYEAPVTFWEVEKEWIEQDEGRGTRKKRPDFLKTGMIELQAIVDHAKLERGTSEEKTDKELKAAGALAFARSISNPDMTPERARARERWKRAKVHVLGQVRAQRMARGLSRTVSFKSQPTRTAAPGSTSTTSIPSSSTTTAGTRVKHQSGGYQSLV